MAALLCYHYLLMTAPSGTVDSVCRNVNGLVLAMSTMLYILYTAPEARCSPPPPHECCL